MRENEVRTQVSGARSAQNDPGLMSSAVKQTPLTETLLPVPSSLGVCSAAIVILRFSPRCSMRTILPTSSTMPVNISASQRTDYSKPRTASTQQSAFSTQRRHQNLVRLEAWLIADVDC